MLLLGRKQGERLSGPEPVFPDREARSSVQFFYFLDSARP